MAKEKHKKDFIFSTNPHKANSRVTINSFMMGSLFFILTLLMALKPENFHSAIMVELLLAVPMLYVSSLAYSKVGYWENPKMWDSFGWFTNNIGNGFILNAVGLMVASVMPNLSLIYFVLILALMIVYSIINIIYKPETIGEKVFKFLFFFAIIFFGGILPLLTL